MTVVHGMLTVDEQNPWPGLEAFDESAERFFNGRDEQRASLRLLVRQAPLTVLFGASGLGKTSLLRAGLFPLLRQDHVLPVYLRLDVQDRKAPLIDQVLRAFREEVSRQDVDAPAWQRGETLWEYLHRPELELWSAQNHLLTPLFVFDQFEEIFTLGRDNVEPVARFRIDLADLVENRIPDTLDDRRRQHIFGSEIADGQRHRVLLSFREDFLPVIEELRRVIPSIMRNRLRLMPMSAEQAFQAVHKTAPQLADETMARRIVDFVAGQESGAAAPDAQEDALSVEPALLSLVCLGLNERRKASGKIAFDSDLLRTTGQAIVADFYAEALSDMPDAVRRFIQEQLITENGYRKPYDVDDARTLHGIREEQLQALVDRRLLRREPVRDTTRVELTHDLLTPVVRVQRDVDRALIRMEDERRDRRRFVRIGSALGLAALVFAILAVLAIRAQQQAEGNQKRAERSAEEARANAVKLQQALADLTTEKERAERAEHDAKEDRTKAELLARSEVEARERADAQADLAAAKTREALAAAQAESASKEQESAARKEADQLTAIAKAAESAALKNEQEAKRASGEAVQQRREADRLRDLAIAQDLASRSRLLQRSDWLERDPNLDLASQMALHAYLRYRDNCRSAKGEACAAEVFDPNILSALQTVFNRLTVRPLLRASDVDKIGTLMALLSAGMRDEPAPFFVEQGVVSGDKGGTVLQVVRRPQSRPRLLSARVGRGVTLLDLPDGWADVLTTQKLATVDLIRLDTSGGRRTSAMAMSAQGIAVGRMDGSLSLWSSGETPDSSVTLSPMKPSRLSSEVTALAFAPSGRWFVSGTLDGVVRRHDGPGSVVPLPVLGRLAEVRSLLVATSGDTIVAGTRDGIWRSNSQRPLERVGAPGVAVGTMALTPDAAHVAYADSLGAIWAGDLSTLGIIATKIIERRQTLASALEFSPNGQFLATGWADGTIQLFPVEVSSGGSPAVFEGHTGSVEAVAFADDTLLYSSGADGTVRVWFTRMDRLAAMICKLVGKDTRLSGGVESTLRGLLQMSDRVPSACPSIVARAEDVGGPGRTTQ